MILEKETFEKFGYYSTELAPFSGKFIVCQCACCATPFDKKMVVLSSSNDKANPVCSNKKCIRWKIDKTCVAKYGTSNLREVPAINEKIKKTCQANYGGTSPFSSKEILAKARATHLASHGVDNPFKLPSVQAQIKKTNLANHGVENLGNLPETIKAIKAANKKKFGVEWSFQAEEVKAKIKKTMLKRYGAENPQKVASIHDKTRKTCLERYGVTTALVLPSSRKILMENNIKKYGVAYPVCLIHKKENEIKTWLNSIGGHFEPDQTLLAPKQLDLYDPTRKIAIEYCGLHWHNEASPEPRGRLYHFNKYAKCLELGIRLITIFEDEWLEAESCCKNFLKSVIGEVQSLAGRNCEVAGLDKVAANLFIEENHIQGSSKTGLAWFGLTCNNELVGCLELGRHHRGKQDLVLTRLCFKDGVRVHGGSSKLFKPAMEWAKAHNYKTIVSWSDNRWSQGQVYESMGFVLDGNLKPDYSYVNTNGYKGRLSKQSQKKSTVGCPADETESSWAAKRKLAKIWDCGKKRWKYTI